MPKATAVWVLTLQGICNKIEAVKQDISVKWFGFLFLAKSDFSRKSSWFQPYSCTSLTSNILTPGRSNKLGKEQVYSPSDCDVKVTRIIVRYVPKKAQTLLKPFRPAIQYTMTVDIVGSTMASGISLNVFAM